MTPSIPFFQSRASSTVHLASLLGLAYVSVFFVVSYLVYSVIIGVYQIYFSPFRKIPGPKSWITFPVLRHISAIRGNLDSDCRRFFDQYKSDAIRVGSTEVYFNSAAAWQDIHGHGRTPQLPKPNRRLPGEVHSIINADDANHTRFRKALSHAFSERALREQESLLQSYTSLLIDRLSEKAADDEVANMTAYYNFITFDIIVSPCDIHEIMCLTVCREICPLVARSVALLQIGYHWWVQHVSNLLKNFMIDRASFAYPLFSSFVRMFQTKARFRARARTFELARELVTARLNDTSQTDRKDFIDMMEKHKGDADEISTEEMVANMFVFIVAGSETTATLLTGITYWLLRTPHALKRITDEIRSTFKSEDEITIQAVTTKLPYTIACLQEALRIYPPAPSVFTRLTLEEECISGHVVPKGTTVAVHQSGAYWSETNFQRAKEFIPERWLPQSIEDPNSEFYHDNRKVHEPFAVGPRNCIGRNLALAEMRLILTRVLWNFDMELGDGMEGWALNQKTYLVWSKPSLNVKFRKRVGLEREREMGEKDNVKA